MMRDKLTLLFKPFLLTLIGLMTGYSLLNWIVFIRFRLISLKDIVVNIGIPLILAGLAAWFLLRPGLRILNLKTKRGNWRDFYCFILWAILIVPLVISQAYLETATGKLTALRSIKEINNSAPTRYYTLETRYIDKRTIGVYPAFDVSGKHNENFNMSIYVAMPIFESEKDTSGHTPLGWLGVAYHKTISNRLEQHEKEAKYQEFANESQKDFDNKNTSQFVYLDRISNSDTRDGYKEAIKQNPVYKPNETILIGVNEPFEARNGKKLEWMLGSALVGSLVWLTMLLIPKIDQKQLELFKAGKPDKAAQKEKQEFLALLKPQGGYFVTLLLIYINTAVFLLMAIKGLGFTSFKGQDLLNWGANYGPLIKNGEWWRLLTSIFLHGGLMHLLANAYGLLFAGIFLEPLLGRAKYLTLYLLTGVLASLASVWWNDATISVGASGAIFGLYGIFIALLLTKAYPPALTKPFLINIGIFIAYNLAMGLASEGIDNAAHIGGLLSGFAAGLILAPGLRRQAEEEEVNMQYP